MTEEQLKDVNKALNSLGIENVQNIVVISNSATNGEVLKKIFSGGNQELRSVSAPNIIYLDDIETCRGGFKEEWWNALYQKGMKQ